MKSFAFISSLGLAVALTPLAQASGLAAIAQCAFNNQNLKCDALASICVDQEACGCGPELIVRCNQKEIFYGAWRSDYQENPETYIVQGIDSGGDDMDLRLLISATSGTHGNPSHLQMNGKKIQGFCKLNFDTTTTALASASIPGGTQ